MRRVYKTRQDKEFSFMFYTHFAFSTFAAKAVGGVV